eukprot:gene8605-6287_t
MDDAGAGDPDLARRLRELRTAASALGAGGTMDHRGAFCGSW